MEETKKFDQWAVVELMGRQVLAGRVTEEVIGGCAFIRVDVPEVETGEDQHFGEPPVKKTRPGYTRYLTSQAIYALNPCTEAVARAAAASYRIAPPIVLDFKPDVVKALPSGNSDDELWKEHDEDDQD